MNQETMTTDKTIEEMNRAIRHFMNIQGTDMFLSLNYKYHEDWNQLMKVVEKIESSADQDTGHMEVEITENHCTIYSANFKKIVKTYNPESKILSVHKAIYDFIIWYTTTKQKD